jgi:hypothetical protein
MIPTILLDMKTGKSDSSDRHVIKYIHSKNSSHRSVHRVSERAKKWSKVETG